MAIAAMNARSHYCVNDIKPVLRPMAQIQFGFFSAEALKQLLRRIAQVKERSSIFIHQKTPILADGKTHEDSGSG